MKTDKKSHRADSKKSVKTEILVIMAIVLGVVFYANTKPASESASEHQVPTPRSTGSPELPGVDREKLRRADAYFERLVKAANSVKDRDPQATKLVSLFMEKVIPVVYDKSGVLFAARSMMVNEGQTFLIIVEPEDRSFLGGVKAQATFSYDRAGFYAVRDKLNWSEWFVGAVMVHEMVHWYDVTITGRENPLDKRQWLEGEVRAHSLEDRLLNQVTDGKLYSMIRNVIADDALSVPTKPNPNFRAPTPKGHELLATVWPNPPMSPSEKRMRELAAITSCLFSQSENMDDKIQAYRMVASLTGLRL